MPWISNKKLNNIEKEIASLRLEVTSLRQSSMIYVGPENPSQYFSSRTQSKPVSDVVMAIADELGIEIKIAKATPEYLIVTRNKP